VKKMDRSKLAKLKTLSIVEPHIVADGANIAAVQAYRMMACAGLGKDYICVSFSLDRDLIPDPEMICSDTASFLIYNREIIDGVGENSIHKIRDGIYAAEVSIDATDHRICRSYIMVSTAGGAATTGDRLNNFIEWVVDNALTAEKKRLRKEQKQKHELLDGIILPEEQKSTLFSEVEQFIDGQATYKDLGLPWKRGIVLYGPPGNGKTKIIRTLASYFNLQMTNMSKSINNGCPEIAVENKVFAGKTGPLSTLSTSSLVSLFYPEKRKPTIYYIEDMDKLLPGSSADIPAVRLSALLNEIDGVDSVDGVLFIATTNHANELAEAIMARPGRFDTLYEITLPGDTQILKMLNRHKIKVDGKEPIGIIGDLRGYSMAFVEEFAKISKMMYKTTELSSIQASEVVKRIRDHNERYKKHFKDGGIGFSS
jgi:hypothetical protein